MSADRNMKPGTTPDMGVFTVLCIGLAMTGCASPSAPARDVRNGHDVVIASAADNAVNDKLVSTTPGARDAEPKAKPDFSGSWSLDTKASDDPQEKMKEIAQAMRQNSGGGRGMRGGSGGQGRGGGMGGGRRGSGASGGAGGRGEMASGDLFALAAVSRTLDITHEDPTLLIADENDRRQRLFTDFRGASVSASGGLQQRVTVAGWEGAVLVVETTLNNGSKLIQRYQANAERSQLTISSAVHLPGMQPALFRLVYDRVKRGADVGRRVER